MLGWFSYRPYINMEPYYKPHYKAKSNDNNFRNKI